MTTTRELEPLLRDRLRISEDIAKLHPVYGPSGTYVSRRDILESQLRKKHRIILSSTGEKFTATQVDDEVKTDPEYITFVTEAEKSRERLFLLYSQLKDITYRIQWLMNIHGDESDDNDVIYET